VHTALDAGQRAVLALEFLPDLEAEAKARKAQSNRQKPRRSSVPSAHTRADEPRRATQEAAELTGAKPRAVQAAKRVAKHVPELLPDVKAGKTSLRAAERKAKEKQAASSTPKPKKKKRSSCSFDQTGSEPIADKWPDMFVIEDAEGETAYGTERRAPRGRHARRWDACRCPGTRTPLESGC